MPYMRPNIFPLKRSAATDINIGAVTPQPIPKKIRKEYTNNFSGRVSNRMRKPTPIQIKISQ